MHVSILGAAAGGGLPQWNCRCSNCVLARSGSPLVDPLTQSSIAISSDGEDWYLLNVSPDIREQIHAFPPLTPEGDSPRGTGIAGCVLTDAEIDHVSGLIFLREGTPFQMYSTPIVRRWLTDAFPIEPMLSAFAPRPWDELAFGNSVNLKSANGKASTLWVESIDLSPHPPIYVRDHTGDAAGSVIALMVEDRATGGKMLYAPGVEAMTPQLDEAAQSADLVLYDGTFWSLTEMVDQGLSTRNALDMGHMPINGEGGSLRWLQELPAKTKAFIHINNTNPILNNSTPEHEAIKKAGIGIASDGEEYEV